MSFAVHWGKSRWQRVLAPSIEKLSQVLHKRFECRLSFTQVVEASFGDTNEGTISWGPNIIPIQLQDGLVGCVEIESESYISSEDRELIQKITQDFLDVVITRTIQQVDLDESIQGHPVVDVEVAENVIPFVRPKKNFEEDWAEVQEDVPGYLQPGSKLFQLPILIEGQIATNVMKVALQLHSLSKRRHFIRYSELGGNGQFTLRDMQELGPATVFVEDITSLSPVQQKTLADYLELQSNSDSAQIIAGSTKLKSELKGEIQLSPRLLKIFSSLQLDLETPH